MNKLILSLFIFIQMAGAQTRDYAKTVRDFNQAQSEWREILSAPSVMRSDIHQVLILLQIIEIDFQIYRLHNYDFPEVHLKEAETWELMAAVYIKFDEPELAKEYLIKSIQFRISIKESRFTPDPANLLKDKGLLAMLYLNENDIENAEQIFSYVYRHSIRLSPSSLVEVADDLILYHNNFAEFFQYIDLEKSLSHYTDGQKIKIHQLTARLELGIIDWAMFQEQIESLYQIDWSIDVKQQLRLVLISFLIESGERYFEQKNISSATKFYELALFFKLKSAWDYHLRIDLERFFVRFFQITEGYSIETRIAHQHYLLFQEKVLEYENDNYDDNY